MAENSKIEWTDHTFNPWIGCTKVSDGCKHCYAEAMMDKRYGRVQWGPQGTRVRTSAENWRKPLTWNRKAEKAGKRARVFCASLADVFEDKPDQPEMDDWRAQLMQLIQETPNLDWLLLTKRPENVMRLFDIAWRRFGGQPVTALPTNIWIGASVENQEQADKRIPELLKIPAAVRFLSMEPLLGPVDLQWCDWCGGFGKHDCYDEVGTIDWVIVGGESGTNASRPMYPAWVQAIRDECRGAGIPFFFKQWGDAKPDVLDVRNWEYRGRNFNAKKGGRLLDGIEWNEFPEAQS